MACRPTSDAEEEPEGPQGTGQGEAVILDHERSSSHSPRPDPDRGTDVAGPRSRSR